MIVFGGAVMTHNGGVCVQLRHRLFVVKWVTSCSLCVCVHVRTLSFIILSLVTVTLSRGFNNYFQVFTVDYFALGGLLRVDKLFF